ncbi:MAG: histidinol-phosphate transaminase [Thermodesulfovibrio sp.]|uniref:histidinol-phosphate transaminase n=2 Tax=unclassified Thermodesulfovibrio TaxID=2645936 RepID=UPI0024831471|nr:histidinol-phosphate transaminase [Thermodesulfovibrio sp. 1176]MDI1471289.1 histidinol-phosphate transaminase [Thermodesulfovibrio sp. 1176]MDI6714706.1 histidinol-phosphate transaminase [Thermodesulfovibrio sp.]
MNKIKPYCLVRKNIQKLIPYQAKEIPCKIKLDANESPFPVKLSDFISEINIPLNRYPDPEALALRKALSKKIKLNYKKLIVGNGSDELIYYLILTFGGPVLYPVPTFAMYKIIAQSVGVEQFESKLDKNFDIKEEEILKIIKLKKPRLIFLSSPNNPTGNTFSTDKILKIIELAKKHSSIVVIDEAYQPFSSNKGFLTFLKDYDNLLILRTLSKIGFAGLRVGYLIGDEQFLREIVKVRLPYNLDSITQYVATEALNKFYSQVNKFISQIVKERDRLYRELLKIKGVKVYPSEANFILLQIKNSKDVYKKLINEGILVRELSSTIKNAIRVTVGTKDENDEFLKTLRKILEETL